MHIIDTPPYFPDNKERELKIKGDTMLLLVTALYCEAKPFIDYYQLKKNHDITKFQVFENDEVKLIITHPGSMEAAIAVTYLCSYGKPSGADLIVSIGTCAAREKEWKKGSLFLCHKIIDETTNRVFYPDMIFRHPFEESAILTCPKVRKEEELSRLQKQSQIPMLFDMETAGVYQAASYFFQPHQMIFLKIVFDYGTDDLISAKKITEYMERNKESITGWLQEIRKSNDREAPVFSTEEEQAIQKMVHDLNGTMTMEHKLRQYLTYYKLVQGNVLKVLDEFYGEKTFPCQTKKEGKMYFEQLTDKLL